MVGFALLVGCSIHTLQSVESGRLKLSKTLATLIYIFTGVGVDWLLKNDLKSAPVAATSFKTYSGETVFDPYSLETFREAKKLHQTGEWISLHIAEYMFSFYGQMSAILNSAAARGHAGAAILQTAKWLDASREQFGHDNSVVPNNCVVPKPTVRLRRTEPLSYPGRKGPGTCNDQKGCFEVGRGDGRNRKKHWGIPLLNVVYNA